MKRWLATTVLLLLPAAAVAEQLEYGIRSQGGWTDNVFATGDDTEVAVDTNGDGIVDDTKKEGIVSDWSLRLSPWGRVADPDGDLTWSLRYQPSYEYYLHESELRDFDHDATAEVSWRVGDRTVLSASETYQKFHSLVRFNENADSPTDSAVFRGRNDDIESNVIVLGLRHHYTPRDIFIFNGAYNFRDYSNENSTDRWTSTFGTTYQHTLTERTTIGVRGSWTRQTFERDIGDDITTDYYNISALLDHRFSRTLSIELSVGPALIDGEEEVVNFSPEFGVRAVGNNNVAVDADDCLLLNDALPLQEDPDLANYNPRVAGLGFTDCGVSGANTVTPGELDLLGYPRGAPLEPGSGTAAGQSIKLTEFSDPFEVNSSGELVRFDDSDFGSSEVTYFARAALIKDWELWHLKLSYERSNDDSGSFGTSNVQDSFEATLGWEPAPLWSVALTGSYTLIDQANDAALPTGLVVQNGPPPAGVDSVSSIATVQRLIVEGDSDAVSYTTASVSLSATRRLTHTSSVFASLFWYQQDQHTDLPNSPSFVPIPSSFDEDTSWNTLTLWVGIDWKFDPIKF